MKLKYGIIFLIQLIVLLTVAVTLPLEFIQMLEVQILLICATIIIGLQFAAIVTSFIQSFNEDLNNLTDDSE